MLGAVLVPESEFAVGQNGSCIDATNVEQSLLVTGFVYEHQHDDAWLTNINLFMDFTDFSVFDRSILVSNLVSNGVVHDQIRRPIGGGSRETLALADAYIRDHSSRPTLFPLAPLRRRLLPRSPSS
ncbi:hypothetical protein GUJ93_ZPchr0040g33533 [Zizania palustris]|uniref:Uncharacterized protein n=1 Tax=Zizania palustris TaxID=103762 RepID=A0A8J5RDX5_ZIZPA|nr:hypothetical protein GUJ93_ZPchr0040g33533 [Zizania palustris]